MAHRSLAGKGRRQTIDLIGAEQEHKSKSDILYPIKSWILLETRYPQ
jgi:hypothetical protein